MGKPLRVLIVEDSEDDALLVIHELERGGYDTTFERVETAEDMTAALEKQSWDIIIADYRLPHFSAPEALELFQQSDLDLPFIVVSGAIGEETAIATMKAGAHDYLMKGNLKRLPPAIERELNEAEVRRQHRQAEEALRQSEEQYRDLYENAPCAYFCVSAADGSVLGCNSGALRLFGYDRETVMRMKVFDLYVDKPDNVSKAQEVFKRFKAGETIRDVELQMKQKDGHPVWISLSVEPVVDRVGNVTESRSIVVDITVRKQAEEELLKSERRYRTLFEDSIDAIVITSREGKLLDVNQAALDLLGYTKVEIMGMNFRELYVDPSNGKRFQQQIDQKGSVANFEVKLFKKDGTELDSLFTVTTKRADNGSIVGYQGFIRDITDQKKLEDQFRQAQKMEAIGRLAGGVAHDFNNLLTTIIGYTETLLTQADKGSPLRSGMEEIKLASDRAANLTRQLLAFSRKQMIQPVVLNLNYPLAEMDKMLRRLIGENIDLVTLLEPELWKVKFDAGQIDQVVMNLAVNARDAMPNGGKLTIETANVELDEAYARQHRIELKPGPFVMLSVSDTGMGIDNETQSHIFEPFFTTKEKGKGTGLGLSTVYGIVKQSGGFIWVYSEPGQGTTFKIYFPKADEEEEFTEEKQMQPQNLEGSETILLAEDDDSARKLIRTVLQDYGYRVLEAQGGKEALQLNEHHKGPIHLLLTDVVMPGMGGRKLAERLQPLQPKMKVLYMSGYTDNAIVHHGVLESGMSFIQKPFAPKVLVSKCRKFLDT